MNISANLTFEQQLQLRIVKDQVNGLSLEQAQNFVVEVMRQKMVKDNLVKQQIMKHCS